MSALNESIVEDAALDRFQELSYAVGHGPHLVPGEPAAERDSFGEVVLVGRLRDAIRRLNPAIPEDARERRCEKRCGSGRRRSRRRTAPATGCCAMACRWNIPRPTAGSRAIMCG